MLIGLIKAVRLNLKKESLIKQQHSLGDEIQTLSRKKAAVKKEYDALVERLSKDNLNMSTKK